MRQKFAKFMSGRNGADELSRFLSYLSIVLLLLSMFLKDGARSTLFVFALIVVIFTYFRMFSKNLNVRRSENAKFRALKQRVSDWFRLRRDMWKQRKEFRFFKCPSCKAVLRVPKDKGKLRIVCKKCGAAFEKKT